jgi:diphthamide synthase (EF-2-diphthine--ammonia ligase)
MADELRYEHDARPKAWLAWSSGKDSAWELHTVRQAGEFEVVDPRKLDRAFAGRRFDRKLLADLPGDVDPCGENGEFRSFACAGPMFRVWYWFKYPTLIRAYKTLGSFCPGRNL